MPLPPVPVKSPEFEKLKVRHRYNCDKNTGSPENVRIFPEIFIGVKKVKMEGKACTRRYQNF
jgi:hypothetical protein